MKKLTAIFLAIITVASLGLFSIAEIGFASAETSTEEPEPNEYGVYVCGNFAYYVLEDGTAEIKLFNPEYGGHVTIPETVYGRTVVGLLGVFSDNKNLTGVTIPNTVKYLEHDTFANCPNLKSVDIPESVEYIGNRVFWNCTSLEILNIGSGVKTIDDEAFRDEKGLGLKEINVDPDNQYFSSVDGVLYNKDKTMLIKYPTANERQVFEIPEGVETISAEAFKNCEAIRKIIFSSTLKTVNYRAFMYAKKLEEVVMNDGLQTIKGSAFLGSGIRTLHFPESVTEASYFGQTNLRYIALPEGIKETPDVFGCDYLVSMYIPSSVVEFGHQAFDYADSLTDIYYGGTQEEWENIVRCECDSGSPELCRDPEDFATIHYNHTHTLDRYYVVKAATSESKGVADHACICGYSVREEYEYEPNSKIEGFCGHGLIWNFDFETGALSISGKGDMYGYGDITDFPWYGIKDRIISVELSEGITSISDYAFENCSNFSELVIPDTVTSIGAYAFSGCSGITELSLGKGIVTIGDYAFSGCSGIEKVELYESVTTIGENTFAGCSGMKEFCVSKNLETFGTKYIADFVNLEKLYVDPEHPTYYTDEYGTLLNQVVYSWETLRIYYYPPCAPYEFYSVPEAVAYISSNAFSGNTNLKTIYTSNKLKQIEESAFDGCTGITDIYFGGTETELNNLKIEANNDVLYNAVIHLEHSHSLTVTDSKPETCTEDGYVKYSCDCGHNETKILPQTGHTESEWIYKSDGVFVKNCSVCGEDYESKAVELKLSNTQIKIKRTETAILGITVTDDFTDDVKITSSKKSVATVDDNGYIKAVSAGEAIITVSINGTDISQTCKVTVTPYVYSVTWTVDGEETVEYIAEGESIPVPETPEIEGMVFVGWTPQIPDEMPSGDLIFHAVFNKFSKSEDYDVSATYSPGCFDEEISLDVAEITGDREPGGVYMVEDEYYKQIGLYNIKAVNSNSEVIQPNEGYTVTIKMAIPEAYKNRTEFMVYHRFTGGGREQLSTENGTLRVENGYLIFEVSEFSEFEIFIPSASVKITHLPDKTTYNYNTDEIDLTGIRLRYTKPDGTSKVITDTSLMTVKGFDGTKLGKQTVTVSYGQYSDTFEVEVVYTWWQWIVRILFLGFLWY